MKQLKAHTYQSGAVSIFIVIFTALLVTIVATSFIQLMLGNQEQATNNDLSQSAYDSALAGVEDAKRALVKLERCKQSGNTTCVSQIKSALNTRSCTSLASAAVGVSTFTGGEVRVGAPEQNQAYTCVSVTLDTQSVTGELDTDGNTKVIELLGTSQVDSIRVSWFSEKNLAANQTPTFYGPVAGDYLLPRSIADWGITTPPIMRAQFIEFSSNVDLDSLDDRAHTLFLYPSTAGFNNFDFSDDNRSVSSGRNAPKITQCSPNFNTVTYLCQAVIDLPTPVSASGKLGYLTLTSIYGASFYKVELLDDSGPTPVVVPFDGVQPTVDATGRAGDLFRRVQASVSVGGLPGDFPNAAINTKGNLCKDFFITQRARDYQNNFNELAAACEP